MDELQLKLYSVRFNNIEQEMHFAAVNLDEALQDARLFEMRDVKIIGIVELGNKFYIDLSRQIARIDKFANEISREKI
jgi:hypothetical protein